jgi:hypothetical protein
MSIIPLDFQRRCEQRWAARFLRPMPTTPQRQFERQDQKLAAPAKPKEKNPPSQSDRLEACIGGVSAEPKPRALLRGAPSRA